MFVENSDEHLTDQILSNITFYETMLFLFQALVDAKISINCDDNDIYDNHIKTDLQRLVSIES